jgi:phosphatidylglycerol---prolipoprotein diacylglyceryl transferase
MQNIWHSVKAIGSGLLKWYLVAWHLPVWWANRYAPQWVSHPALTALNILWKIGFFVLQFLLFTLLSWLCLCAVTFGFYAVISGGLTQPLNIQWGYYPPFFHLLFEVLGYVTSFWMFRQQPMAPGLTAAQRQTLKPWTLIGAIVGAKLPPILENSLTPYWAMAWLFGKSLVGGVLGGIIGTELGKRKNRITVATGDPMVWPFLWGSVVGRIGCACAAVYDDMLAAQPIPLVWLTQWPLLQLLGVNTNAASMQTPWPATIAAQLHRGWVWNVATLELLGLLVLCLIVYGINHWGKLAQGQLFYGCCAGYFMLRLGLEWLTILPNTTPLTVVQGISLLGLGVCVWQWQRLRTPV